MDRSPIPLVILGGRDVKASTLPEDGRDKHPLRGYKAIDLRITGRPLLELVLERLEDAGAFEPIFIAGPRSQYEPLGLDLEIIDTDGSFGENVEAALEAVIVRCPGRPVAFITCDVLVEKEELQHAVEHIQERLPCDFWMPQVRIPEDPAQLGESAWKPRYPVRPEAGEPPVPTLPGHLVVVDPLALRRHLLYRVFTLAYKTRNRPVMYRRAVITRGVLFFLLAEDLRRLLRLRPPTVTWRTIRGGLDLARALRGGQSSSDEIAYLTGRIFVTAAHRRRHPNRRGYIPVIEGISLAKDIDTVEEAREVADRLEQSSS